MKLASFVPPGKEWQGVGDADGMILDRPTHRVGLSIERLMSMICLGVNFGVTVTGLWTRVRSAR